MPPTHIGGTRGSPTSTRRLPAASIGATRVATTVAVRPMARTRWRRRCAAELEAVWRRADGAARIALQGLIQIVVALHHAERGNVAGARRLLAAGRAKVEPYAPRWEGVALDVLLADLRRWEHARLDEERVAAPPRLVLA